MRIAIFDGILEFHVQDSLERALVARGHEVLSTGKIGHGFQFPRNTDSLAHLERAIESVLAFEPDWVFAMRPASLPPVLLARLKRAGIRLIAWFSDDPVLFDLSYAPIVEQYDRVLHCGTSAVLTHYERYFGRPTGVNMPFWTDHHAFPAIWGQEHPESRAMFLGNVQDAVRRRRYFDLARFGDDLRIHGKVGSDYFERSGGYLDTDAEVVAAGARTDWAINIPQWFRDHRGLETWFPGLDELGFFEYPSRVVQTMAMGIPTISVISGGHAFDTYPEMLVAQTVDEAVAITRDPSWTRARLSDLSEAVVRRFDRHFSATARVIALERYLQDDAWMSLDVEERVRWFADVVDTGEPSADTGELVVERVELPASPPNSMPSRAVVVLDPGAGAFGRGIAIADALTALDVRVEIVHATRASFAETIKAADFSSFGRDDAIIVVDIPERLPKGLRKSTDARTMLLADLESPTSDAAGVIESYRLVALTSRQAVERFRDAGFAHVVHSPRVVSRRFQAAVAARGEAPPAHAIRIAESSAREDALVPGLSQTLHAATLPLKTWDELAALSLEELAAAATAAAGVIIPRGPKRAPHLDDLFVHVRYAIQLAMMPRIEGLQSAPDLVESTPLFATPAELGRKAWRLDDSDYWREAVDVATRRLRESMDAVTSARTLLGTPEPLPSPGLHLRSTAPLLDHRSHLTVELEELGWQPRSIICLDVTTRAGERSELLLSIVEDGNTLWSRPFDTPLRLAVAATRSARSKLSLRFSHSGQARVVAPAAAYEIRVALDERELPVPLDPIPTRVLELPQI